MAGCSQLTAAQTCNLTLAFQDPFQQYQARLRAYVSNLTSHWTVSSWFQPLTDSERAQICVLAQATLLAGVILLFLSSQSCVRTS